MKFSREMTGFAVIHLPSGREVGKVREWLLDEHCETVVALLVEGGGWLPQRRLIPFAEIAKIGTDAVLVDGTGLHLTGDPPLVGGRATCRALGKRMLSAGGEELGIVEDFLFEEETGRVTGWRLSSGLIDDLLQGRPVLEDPLQMIVGEDTLIVCDEEG
ncbi:MAG TPA: hypothetical protein GX699_01225 [Firmicutes bacterium]|nr:hypothetical protein [Bacillota bacterium]